MRCLPVPAMFYDVVVEAPKEAFHTEAFTGRYSSQGRKNRL